MFELVVVIGIISIMSGISFSYYNKFSEGKKLESEARRIGNILSIASKKSSSGDQDGCTNLTGYKVSLSSNNNQWNYVLQKCCNTETSCDTNVTTNQLPQNIIATTPETSILFRKSGNEALIDSNQSINSTTITLKNTSLGSKNCINLTVTKVGIVEIGERTTCN